MRDRRLILQGIVRRTRALIGTDMAYLSRNDLKAGETFIDVTDGVETEAYRQIRMPLGTGILGAAAAGGTSIRTNDYLSDPHMNHLSFIDSIVEGEGVKAIMGAPIRIAGRVVGALLVASRSNTIYDDEALTCLEALAAQTAIALEQERLNERITSAEALFGLTESEHASKLQSLSKLVTLDGQLTGCLLEGTGPPGVVSVLSTAIGLPVSVFDAAGQLIVSNSHDGILLPDLNAAVNTSAASGAAVTVNQESSPLTVVAAVAGNEVLGTVVAHGGPGMNLVPAIERSAVFISVMMLFERTLIDADQRTQATLIDDLLSERPLDRTTLASRLAAYELKIGDPCTMLVINVLRRDRYKAMVLARELLGGKAGLVALHEGHLCVMVPGSDGLVWGEKLVTTLIAQGTAATGGCSIAEKGPTQLRAAHQRAQDLVDALNALGRHSECVDSTGLGLIGLLLGNANKQSIGNLVDQQLLPLLEYDKTRKTTLTHTAWTYLENGSHAPNTAKNLNIHPNTVRQRIERIDSLLGSSWRRAPDLIDVHVALRIWRMMTPPESLKV
ncbi:helix-turn-helix domain-containing protein [Arthrobacter echini]|nr:GAF domain-containing protein [Arthrobacter echini]